MKDYLKENRPVIFLSFHPEFIEDKSRYAWIITDVLGIYNNVYYSDGRKISLTRLKRILSHKNTKNFSVIALDKWPNANQIVFIIRQKIRLFALRFSNKSNMYKSSRCLIV
jgi:hypothetical protein